MEDLRKIDRRCCALTWQNIVTGENRCLGPTLTLDCTTEEEVTTADPYGRDTRYYRRKSQSMEIKLPRITNGHL